MVDPKTRPEIHCSSGSTSSSSEPDRGLISMISLGAYTIATHKKLLNTKCKLMLYNALIKCHLECGLSLWGNGPVNQLITLQKKAIGNINGSKNFRCHTNDLFSKHLILKFEDLRSLCYAKLARRFCFYDLPTGIQDGLFCMKQKTSQNTRQSKDKYLIEVPLFKNTKLSQCYLTKIPSMWNTLNEECRNAKSESVFKNLFKKIIFKKYQEKPKCQIKDCFCCK